MVAVCTEDRTSPVPPLRGLNFTSDNRINYCMVKPGENTNQTIFLSSGVYVRSIAFFSLQGRGFVSYLYRDARVYIPYARNFFPIVHWRVPPAIIDARKMMGFSDNRRLTLPQLSMAPVFRPRKWFQLFDYFLSLSRTAPPPPAFVLLFHLFLFFRLLYVYTVFRTSPSCATFYPFSFPYRPFEWQ